MAPKRILVTGIGGNVGQGIIRNIRSLKLPIEIVGCNVDAFSAGNHLCDYFYKVPFANDNCYISRINSIVKEQKIELIIPSTDYEVYFLSKYRESLDTEVAVSDFLAAEIYLDKYKSFLHHKKYDIPFASTFLPEDYKDNFDSVIAKPREGRGSRGIIINPSSIANLGNNYIIQKFEVGREITTAFYVTKKGALHGFITLERKLVNGATNECFVTKEFDDLLKPILEKIVLNSKIRGSANLQSIVTETATKIVPFEINCRISGTNSIRSNFGFEDVKYTIEEYLFGVNPSPPNIKNGIAIRILMDVIYPGATDSANLSDNSVTNYIF